MAYITDNALRSAVAAANGLESAATLPSQWNAIIPSANLFAYNRIRSVLFNRGFTPAQAQKSSKPAIMPWKSAAPAKIGKNGLV